MNLLIQNLNIPLDIFDKLFLLDKDLKGDDASFFLSSYLSFCERTGDCNGVSFYIIYNKYNYKYILNIISFCKNFS